jgi:hypothetical protein
LQCRPALELAQPQSQYLSASDFQFAGPARVIAGEYDGVKSIIGSPPGMTYLHVRLKAGERWTYQPPRGPRCRLDRILPRDGRGDPERVSKGEVVVFEQGDQAVSSKRLSDAGFVLGSAVKHPYDLVTGYYSVHTNAEALRRGENNIAQIGRRLRDQGVGSPQDFSSIVLVIQGENLVSRAARCHSNDNVTAIAAIDLVHDRPDGRTGFRRHPGRENVARAGVILPGTPSLTTTSSPG